MEPRISKSTASILATTSRGPRDNGEHSFILFTFFLVSDPLFNPIQCMMKQLLSSPRDCQKVVIEIKSPKQRNYFFLIPILPSINLHHLRPGFNSFWKDCTDWYLLCGIIGKRRDEGSSTVPTGVLRGIRYDIVASFPNEVVLSGIYTYSAVQLIHIHKICPCHWDHITLSDNAIAD